MPAFDRPAIHCAQGELCAPAEARGGWFRRGCNCGSGFTPDGFGWPMLRLLGVKPNLHPDPRFTRLDWIRAAPGAWSGCGVLAADDSEGRGVAWASRPCLRAHGRDARATPASPCRPPPFVCARTPYPSNQGNLNMTPAGPLSEVAANFLRGCLEWP